jgi:toxin YoeB
MNYVGSLVLPRKKNAQPNDQTPEESSPLIPKDELKRWVLVFDVQFLDDLTHWVETDRKIALRLLSLVEEIGRTPFEGTGKPERLKYQDGNVWSRRLTEKDRIVYLIMENRIEFLQGRYHYRDR